MSNPLNIKMKTKTWYVPATMTSKISYQVLLSSLIKLLFVCTTLHICRFSFLFFPLFLHYTTLNNLVLKYLVCTQYAITVRIWILYYGKSMVNISMSRLDDMCACTYMNITSQLETLRAMPSGNLAWKYPSPFHNRVE